MPWLFYWLCLNLNEMWPEPFIKKKTQRGSRPKEQKMEKQTNGSQGVLDMWMWLHWNLCAFVTWQRATCGALENSFFRVSIAGCLSAILLGERLSISCCLGNINLQLTHSQMPDPINWKMQDANYKLAAPKSTSSSATGHARRSRKTE